MTVRIVLALLLAVGFYLLAFGIVAGLLFFLYAQVAIWERFFLYFSLLAIGGAAGDVGAVDRRRNDEMAIPIGTIREFSMALSGGRNRRRGCGRLALVLTQLFDQGAQIALAEGASSVTARHDWGR